MINEYIGEFYFHELGKGLLIAIRRTQYFAYPIR
jgi:hypothetical protein